MAADYLAATDAFEDDFNLIREALKRPYARMDGDYQQPFSIPTPNFIAVRTVAQILAQRTQCYLLVGQSDRARRDLALMHDLCRFLEARPTGKPMTLVATMIDAAVAGLYVSTVADGLRLQAWGEPQLATIQEQLKEINLLPLLVAGFECERLAACRVLETTSPGKLNTLFSSGDRKASLWVRIEHPESVLLALAPQGWVYQNMTACARLEQKIIESLDLTNNLIAPHKADDAGREMQAAFGHFSPYSFLAAMMTPNFVKATQTLARNQTMRNEALVACALERYRLARHQYPETLDALAPEFIEKVPHDLIGGQPLKYHPVGNGRFVLYSVGWNETDDGGVAGKLPSEIDWVWQ